MYMYLSIYTLYMFVRSQNGIKCYSKQVSGRKVLKLDVSLFVLTYMYTFTHIFIQLSTVTYRYDISFVLSQSFVEVSARHLWSILYPGDLTPEWNSQCGVNEVCWLQGRKVHSRRCMFSSHTSQYLFRAVLYNHVATLECYSHISSC